MNLLIFGSPKNRGTNSEGKSMYLHSRLSAELNEINSRHSLRGRSESSEIMGTQGDLHNATPPRNSRPY